MVILVILILIVPFLWMIGFLIATDFSVPLRNARQFHHILVLFPHADDEAVTCAGTLHRLSARGSSVTLALLTRGERGPNATRSTNLKETRTKEARAAAAALGISRLIQEDFADGELRQHAQELRLFIAALIEQEQPDLLITYDLSGLYGHPDHVACSEIVTELKQTRFQEIPLWYATLPKRLLARVRLPADIAADPHTHEKRAYPTHKLFIGASLRPKIKAWYTYKSQRVSLAQGIGPFLPTWLLWFFLSMMLFEYFADGGQ